MIDKIKKIDNPWFEKDLVLLQIYNQTSGDRIFELTADLFVDDLKTAMEVSQEEVPFQIHEFQAAKKDSPAYDPDWVDRLYDGDIYFAPKEIYDLADFAISANYAKHHEENTDLL